MNNMNHRHHFWRQLMAFLMLRTPMRSYGELVLRPATMPRRGAPTGRPRTAGHNKA